MREHLVLDDDLVGVKGLLKHLVGLVLIGQVEEHLQGEGYITFINTSESFATPIGGERVMWVCINLCL